MTNEVSTLSFAGIIDRFINDIAQQAREAALRKVDGLIRAEHDQITSIVDERLNAVLAEKMRQATSYTDDHLEKAISNADWFRITRRPTFIRAIDESVNSRLDEVLDQRADNGYFIDKIEEVMDERLNGTLELRVKQVVQAECAMLDLDDDIEDKVNDRLDEILDEKVCKVVRGELGAFIDSGACRKMMSDLLGSQVREAVNAALGKAQFTLLINQEIENGQAPVPPT